jgi:hypothetical protein
VAELLPEAAEEMAEAAAFYEQRRPGLGDRFLDLVAIAHAKRRPDYWVSRLPRGRR